jgi:phenylpropionate dioxygenase-like ring-hydroxylating dioxygenase large terminal subunit
VAHDGLTRLFGKSYAIEASGWVDKMSGYLVDRPSDNPSERFYQKHLPHVPHLPEANQRLWLYYKLWPNMAFDIYADQIDFMQWLPLSPTTSLLREMVFALPDDRREMKLTRYANWRINRVVNAEDTWLIERVQQGMASQSYTAGPIGASEVCLRSFAAKIRERIPEARLHRPPAPGWSKRLKAVD